MIINCFHWTTATPQTPIPRHSNLILKRLRWCISALWILPLLLLMMPAAVQAQFNYVTNKGSITVTGYTGPGGAVSIPSSTNGLPVTRIGDNAFYGCTRMAAITIPNSVTSIGSSAFDGCSSLASVMVPDSVTSIGDYAFYHCSSLTNITIPNSVISIGAGVFESCTSLTSVIIPNSISGLPSWAFCFCSSLATVTIPNSVSSIGGQAFRGCSSLTAITIPNSVTNLIAAAFLDCSNLSSITIPDSVISIGSQAFYRCGLSSVIIPASVMDIGMQAFVNNELITIVVDDLNPVYSSVGGVLFDKSRATLIQYPRGKVGSSYPVPNTVTIIGPWAFDGCSGLTSVVVPASVISMEGYAFSGCTNLTGAYFQGSTPNIYYGSSTFNADNYVTVYYLPETFGWGPTFSGRPTVLWNPHVQTASATFGVQTNRFGFTITGTSGLIIVVEACTSLTDSVWTPVGTNTIIYGSSYFSDPSWTNYPGRYYRLRSP